MANRPPTSGISDDQRLTFPWTRWARASRRGICKRIRSAPPRRPRALVLPSHRDAGTPVDPSSSAGLRRNRRIVALLCDGACVAWSRGDALRRPPARLPRLRSVRPSIGRTRKAVGQAFDDADHAACAFDRIDLEEHATPFDVVHDHSGLTALAMANHLATPMVHTIHGPSRTSGEAACP